MKYTIKAWLPVLPFFVAVDENGRMGLLSEFGFVPKGGDWFIASAVTKHGYIPLDEERKVDGNDTQALLKLAKRLEKTTLPRRQ